uniref:hypothetical protein n=1 Tax=Helicobacter pylori TaxID=210 RepID=UPI0018A15A06
SSPCIEFNSVSPTDKNGAYGIKWFENVVARINERENNRVNERENNRVNERENNRVNERENNRVNERENNKK